ncbi:6-phosphofructo-2-kinase [Aureococcus anophagefferens]|nr:6-phosphofructo-2-kinase [Aureococcus anophagefferens]
MIVPTSDLASRLCRQTAAANRVLARRRARAEALCAPALRAAPRDRTQQPPPLDAPMASLDMASPKTAEASRKNGSSPKAADYPKNYVKSQEHLLSASTRNPEPTMMPPPVAGLAGALGDRHVICFIGLPARGKQFMAERLCRYLKFFHGAQCEIFDLAKPEYGSDVELGDALSAYLEEEDATATTQLIRSMEGIDDDSLDRLKKNVDSGKIAILDTSDGFSTLSRAWSGATKDSRYAMQKHLASMRVRVKLLFIEVIVCDKGVVRKFLTQRLAVGPDGERLGPQQLAGRLRATDRALNEYGRSFVTIQDDGSEDELSYVKLIDYGDKVVTNRIRGFLLMQIVKYLSHVHPKPRTVYLSRHGQSLYNACQKIGGNPGLTDAGERYAKWLGEFVPGEVWSARAAREAAAPLAAPTDDDADEADGPPPDTCARPLFGRLFPCVDPSTGESSLRPIVPAAVDVGAQAPIDTARHIPHPVLELRQGGVWHQMSPRVYRNLDEIFAGDCEGMTYKEIEETFNEESLLRKRDKLGYRYPRGESYLDLIARLDPLMHELESYTEPLLVVSHQATLRILYSYLVGIPRAEAPKIEIPLHNVIKITWDGWRNFEEVRIPYDDGKVPDLQKAGRACDFRRRRGPRHDSQRAPPPLARVAAGVAEEGGSGA